MSYDLRLLLIQILVVVAVARLCGAIAHRAGQPRVIGEIIGGIALGPSLFGAALPSLYQLVFAPTSLSLLRAFAEVGVVLFMFSVGLDFDLVTMRQKKLAAVVVSHASIALPFLLGIAIAVPLFDSFAPVGTPFLTFALFIGIAMSITAFPVLARIVSERGLNHTPAGTIALTCAAVDDITAWCLLALVAAMARSQGPMRAALTTASVALFALLMLRFVRPWVARFVTGEAAALLFLFASAAATEIIGVHAVFGAFLAGVIMPRNSPVRERLMDRLGTIHLLLLPLFFAFTGLRTELRFFNEPRTWLLCAGVIVVATIGKFGGSAIAARVTGSSWNEALVIGALMNSRGLMELVVLNIGYDLGMITPPLFAIMVIMALVTTAATGPLLSLWKRSERDSAKVTAAGSPAEPAA
jgi:Kef-type K+ transport system membrane component KefB